LFLQPNQALALAASATAAIRKRKVSGLSQASGVFCK
jgi:hypothetical protein